VSNTIKINAGNGNSFSAYVANKKGVQGGRGILLIQEIFGVNQTMRDLADDFSLLGYVVVCPDLFWRIRPEIRLENYDKADWDAAFGYFKAFDVERGVDDLKATLDHMRGMKEITGKVATIGYCLGGKLAYLMATRSNIDAAVSYYGVGLEALLDEAPRIARPLMLHLAGKDRFVPPEAQARIKAALLNHPNVALNVFEEQDHAFARVGGDHWDAEAAAIANEMTVGFLRQSLAA
jgi:carboxymethylenebutenolidase